MKKRKIRTVSAVVITMMLALVVYCSKKQHFLLSQFIAPDTCGGCHTEIYGQWKNSMHNLSHADTLYQRAAQYLAKGLGNPDETREAESCVKCHTPVGVVTGFPSKVSDDQDKTPDIAKQGIQCDYCHSAVKARKLYNNGIILEPGRGDEDPGTKRGPLKDSKSDYHKTEFSEFHTGAEICGTCHNVRHIVYGTVLESTYDEWLAGPYGSGPNRVTCQGCHMHQRPGVPATGSTERPKNPGSAADGGRERDHVFTHYFIGANTHVPGVFGDKAKSKMAEERLKNSAELSVKKNHSGKGIHITVRNTGAGHKLPTGLTDFRQMWLEIIVTKNGKTVYQSGVPDRNGHLGEGTIIYNTVFGDGVGKKVLNIAKAKEIIRDRRVPPGGSLEEDVLLPGTATGTLNVKVRLLYRLAPQKVIDVVLGKGTIKLPVIAMKETAAQLEF